MPVNVKQYHRDAYQQNRDRIRQKRRNRNFVTFLISLVDLFLINLSVLIAYYFRFHLEMGVEAGWAKAVPIAPLMEYLKALVFIDYFFLVLFSLFRLYRRERSRWMMDEWYGLWKSLALGYLFVTSLTFFVRVKGFEYSRLVFLYSFLLSVIALAIWRYLVLRLEQWHQVQGGNVHRVLILGSGEMARIVVKKLQEKPELGYRISGFTAPVSESLRDLEGFPFLGPLDQFQEMLISHHIDEVFISESELSHFKLLEIVSICEELGVYCKMVPNVYDLLIDFADMNDLDGLPLVAVREQPMYELSLLIKRSFDILFSCAVLLITSPLWLLIMILIKMDSSGHVFFSQIRAGVGGKPFKMFKFRTMYQDAEAQLSKLINLDQLEEPVFKIKNDPRITRVGQFLRRTSLDEIPQFWNVLIGDMSVVGPRPEETQLVDKYNIWQKRRLKIKPGITGMQQIMCRGTTSLVDRVKYDIFYLRKHSLLLDIWIVLKTIPVVLSGKGAS